MQGGIMSTALDEAIAEEPVRLFTVPANAEQELTGKNGRQAQPFVAVLIAITLALNGAALLIESILTWLALHHSGVMAP
jgi:hypothetical protein